MSTPSLRPLRFLLIEKADLLPLRILKLKLFWGVNAVHGVLSNSKLTIHEAKSFKFCTMWTKIEISKSEQIF